MSALFKGRSVVEARDLKGPRVYSTDLLPSFFELSRADDSVRIAARALKIKMITKGLVTLNGAYLVSPLGIHLFDAHPDLLEGPAIVPVFRTDRQSLEELVASVEGLDVAGIDRNRLREHIARVEQSVTRVMPWDPPGVDTQYKGLLLAGLRNPASAIFQVLTCEGKCSSAEVERIARDIEALEFRDSRNLRNYIATVSEAARGFLSNFAAACYHINGTRVVNCETGTDLSPLSDFKAADLVLAARDANRERLSDEAVFLKAFMGYALGVIQAAVVAEHVIDALSFKTIHALSEPLRQSGFQEKYDGIIRQYLTSSGFADARAALDSLGPQAIADVAAALAKEFETTVGNEIRNYSTRSQVKAREAFYEAGTDVVHDALGMIPGVGDIVAFTDAAGSSVKLVKAAVEIGSVRDYEGALSKARERQEEAIRTAIERLRVGERTRSELLDAVALLSDIYGMKVARA
jgi:hypothetical protein